MIDFTRAFNTAWERTVVILFQPFDAWKWFVIGFNAFLVLLSEGGASFNQPYHSQTQTDLKMYESVPGFLHASKQVVSWLYSFLTSPWVALYIGLALIFLIAWVVLCWVGCRGQFLFLDNIVRNRAAISWPWHRYAREGNAWFVFRLCVIVVSWILAFGILAIFIVLGWSWINQERDPNGGEIAVLVCFILAALCFWIVYAAIFFLLRSFVVPLMFKQTFGFWRAFEAVGRLAVDHPGSILVYLLISFCLEMAAGILSVVIFCLVSCVACCVFWCIVMIPIIGTLLLLFVLSEILLPVLVFYRCFQLDCLAQFGPEYDVWIVDVPPPGPISPQPPPV